jgi:flavorubredoxin
MTTVTEIAPDVFRISTFVGDIGMQFNQFLVRDHEPLLYHTGMKAMFPIVREAISKVIDPKTLRWVAFSHFESDECGALNEFLAIAPAAQPLCSFAGAMVSVNDFAARPARGLQDDEVLTTDAHRFRLIRTPHLPHNWEASHLFEESTRTLFCSDLFHQDGEPEPTTTSEPELMKRIRETLVRYQAGPFSNYLLFTPMTLQQLARLAALRPEVLATMHGSTFKGSGEHALHELSNVFREILAKSS